MALTGEHLIELGKNQERENTNKEKQRADKEKQRADEEKQRADENEKKLMAALAQIRELENKTQS